MPSGLLQTPNLAVDSDFSACYPPSCLLDFGKTLVIAPHPDDESLGCGGAIALLRSLERPVSVLFISDGTLSHPNSQRYPAPKLCELREAEAAAALETLGVPANEIRFLRLKDGFVPDARSVGFADAAELCAAEIRGIRPETILLPWRRDPHPDHRATGEIVRQALADSATRSRLVEYLIWSWERAAPDDLPRPGEVSSWRLDISSVLDQKRAAIACHRSQVTHLIDDDPDGFWLSPAVLSHFDRPWEMFLESVL